MLRSKVMEIFIIVAISADGFIAREKNQSSLEWTSSADRDFFVKKTKEAGAVIMGRKTFETINKPLKDRLNLVYSRKKLGIPGVETTDQEPRDLVADLKKRGYSKLAVCGGSSVYTMFLKSGLVNKIYLTVEPVIFGQGIKLFTEDFFQKLTLLSTEKLNDQGALLLEYQVQSA